MNDYGIIRPKNGRRVHVQVQMNLSMDEVRRTFRNYAVGLGSEVRTAGTPPTRRVLDIAVRMLQMHGWDAFDALDEAGETRVTPEVIAWADRCTERLWNSRLIRDRG